MLDILQYTFFQNALLAVILIGFAGGIIGTYVVTRRMVFITGRYYTCIVRRFGNRFFSWNQSDFDGLGFCSVIRTRSRMDVS